MQKLFYYHFCLDVVICHWFCNKRILRFHLRKCIKSHSVRYWEPEWLFRFTIVFQLNNGKNIWSSLKMQWQLPHLTNDYCLAVIGQTINAFINLRPWSFEPPHDKTNNVVVRPAKTQISLGIRPVWPESSLSAWRKLGSLATHWAQAKTLIRLGGCPGWSESALGAHSLCCFVTRRLIFVMVYVRWQ